MQVPWLMPRGPESIACSLNELRPGLVLCRRPPSYSSGHPYLYGLKAMWLHRRARASSRGPREHKEKTHTAVMVTTRSHQFRASRTQERGWTSFAGTTASVAEVEREAKHEHDPDKDAFDMRHKPSSSNTMTVACTYEHKCRPSTINMPWRWCNASARVGTAVAPGQRPTPQVADLVAGACDADNDCCATQQKPRELPPLAPPHMWLTRFARKHNAGVEKTHSYLVERADCPWTAALQTSETNRILLCPFLAILPLSPHHVKQVRRRSMTLCHMKLNGFSIQFDR